MEKLEVSCKVNREKLLKNVCVKLLKRDPGIVEIIQFGSSVYASDLSRDVDLLVISRFMVAGDTCSSTLRGWVT